MKIGALALVRSNISVHVDTGSEQWEFVVKQHCQLKEEAVLTVNFKSEPISLCDLLLHEQLGVVQPLVCGGGCSAVSGCSSHCAGRGSDVSTPQMWVGNSSGSSGVLGVVRMGSVGSSENRECWE